jgi:hypothetical protein
MKTYGNLSQFVLMINPILSPHTRMRDHTNSQMGSGPPLYSGSPVVCASALRVAALSWYSCLPGRFHPQYFVTRTGVA